MLSIATLCLKEGFGGEFWVRTWDSGVWGWGFGLGGGGLGFNNWGLEVKGLGFELRKI